jgi:hypothetical protein
MPGIPLYFSAVTVGQRPELGYRLSFLGTACGEAPDSTVQQHP